MPGKLCRADYLDAEASKTWKLTPKPYYAKESKQFDLRFKLAAIIFILVRFDKYLGLPLGYQWPLTMCKLFVPRNIAGNGVFNLGSFSQQPTKFKGRW
jgi:hypothetical protein